MRATASRRWLWALIAAGTAIRVAIAFATYGQVFDMGSYQVVRHAIAQQGIHLYDVVNVGGFHWPYPPGYLPWVAAAGGLANLTGLPFHGIVQLPPILADAALAWLVAAFLRLRGASDVVQLTGAALVALGPTFAMVSGYHGQFDSVAILPAVVALYLWERLETPSRGLVAGGLVGLGGIFKTVPLVMLVALLPTVRSWREAGWLLGSAAAVLVVASLPFLVTTRATYEAAVRDYHGFPGVGGLSLVVQPDLAGAWLGGGGGRGVVPHFNRATRALVHHGGLLSDLIVGALAAFLLRYRPRATTAAVLVWLAVYVLAPGFFFQYLVWGLPFFLMAGYLRAVAIVQALTVVPMLLFYGPWRADGLTAVYAAVMIGIWAALAGALLLVGRGIVHGRPPPDAPRPALLPTPATAPA